jgi:hypothetical protein
MQYLEIPVLSNGSSSGDVLFDNELHFDSEWLAILSKTYNLIQARDRKNLFVTTKIEPLLAEVTVFLIFFLIFLFH